MKNDYKFKLGLALARENELLRKIAAMEAARLPAKYDDTLLPFLELMRKELHANSGKGDRDGWLKMSIKEAINEVSHHGHKLEMAVSARDYPQIAEHCADVANCAMMLADVCGLLDRA